MTPQLLKDINEKVDTITKVISSLSKRLNEIEDKINGLAVRWEDVESIKKELTLSRKTREDLITRLKKDHEFISQEKREISEYKNRLKNIISNAIDSDDLNDLKFDWSKSNAEIASEIGTNVASVAIIRNKAGEPDYRSKDWKEMYQKES